MEIRIPKTWDDIKLKEGIKLFSLETHSGTTEQEYFSFVCEALNINLNLIPTSKVQEVKHQLFSLLSNKPTTDFNTEFIIGGKRYLFDKNLNSISWGQFTDFEMYVEQGFWQNADKIIAMMIRPAEQVKTKWYQRKQFKIAEYDSASVNERAEIFGSTLSVADVWGIALFFYHIVRSYFNHITTSFLRKVQDLQTNGLKSLEKYGGGYQ